MKQDIDYYAIKDFQPSKPVCIDLDGTFVRYHALWYLKGYFSIELMSFPQAFLRAVHDFLGPKNAPVWQESENTSDSLSFLCVHCKSLWSAFKWHLSTRQCTDVVGCQVGRPCALRLRLRCTRMSPRGARRAPASNVRREREEASRDPRRHEEAPQAAEPLTIAVSTKADVRQTSRERLRRLPIQPPG